MITDPPEYRTPEDIPEDSPWYGTDIELRPSDPTPCPEHDTYDTRCLGCWIANGGTDD